MRTAAWVSAVALLAIRDGLTPTLDERAEKRVISLMEDHAIDVEADVSGTRRQLGRIRECRFHSPRTASIGPWVESSACGARPR